MSVGPGGQREWLGLACSSLTAANTRKSTSKSMNASSDLKKKQNKTCQLVTKIKSTVLAIKLVWKSPDKMRPQMLAAILIPQSVQSLKLTANLGRISYSWRTCLLVKSLGIPSSLWSVQFLHSLLEGLSHHFTKPNEPINSWCLKTKLNSD